MVKDRHAGQSAGLSLKIYTVLYIVHTVYIQFIATGWQCTENQSRFSEIEHVFEFIWQSNNLPWVVVFRVNVKMLIKLLTTDARLSAIHVGYRSDSREVKRLHNHHMAILSTPPPPKKRLKKKQNVWKLRFFENMASLLHIWPRKWGQEFHNFTIKIPYILEMLQTNNGNNWP